MPTPLHVLILEDSPADVELMLHELRRAGFEPRWQHVETEPDFLARLAPPPDIILADYTLPQFDALRALRCVQEWAPDIPLIVVTGALSDEAAVACLKQGAADYLLKDRLGRLGEAVRQALAKQDLGVQHRQAHDALRASEQRFRALSEHASDLVGILDADGTYRYASPSHRRILGYAPAEVQGRNVFEFMHPDDVPHTQAAFAKLMQTPGAMETAEFRMRHADGSWRTLEGIGTNRLHDPAVRGTIANARDITERKRAETERVAALAREQATRQVAAIVTASEDAIIGKTLDGTITSWNPAAAHLYGYSAEEAVGQSIALLIPPEHYNELPELLARVARAESIPQFETERLRKDGTRLAVSVSIAPVRAASGTVVGAAVVARDITERKRAEEALRASEARLRTVIDNAPLVVYVVAADGTLLLREGRAAQHITHPRAAVGDSLLETNRDHPAALAHITRALSGQDSTMVNRIGHHTFENYLSPLRDEEGQVTGAIGVAIDVTERVQAEAALRAMLDAAPLLFYTLDPTGVFTMCEGQVLATLGTEPQAIVGSHMADRWPAYPEAVEAIQQALAGETANFVGHVGGMVFDNHLLPMRDDQGQITGVIGVATDITARSHTEEALRASEMGLAAILVATPDAIVIVNKEGRIVRVNAATEQLFGYGREELLGQPVELLLPERFRGGHAQHRASYLAAPQPRPMGTDLDLFARRKDGSEVPVEISLSPLETVEGTFTISSIRDVTERKRGEAALEESNRELARSNAELEQFASIASHDLRSPLNTIGGYAQLVAMRYTGKLDADADEFLAFIVDAVQRMQQLIDDLLSYAQVGAQASPPEPVDCAVLVDEVTAELRAAIAESGAVVTHHGLPTVSGQATQLGQVFQNLIANAIKFRGEAPPQVTVSAQRHGKEWLFTVQDNGVGIDPAQAERIFVPFQRLHTREEYPGTGIGLAVCKKIVERHGGRIWVESEPGRGARFLFTLRAKPAAPATTHTPATRDTRPALTSTRRS